MSRSNQRKPAGRNEFPRVFNVAKVQSYVDPPVRGASATIHRTIAWNASGGLVATGANDKTIRIWNPERTNSRSQIELKGHGREVSKILFNPVREFELASCSADGTVRFWDTRSKTVISKLDVGGDLFTLSWSVDGTALIAGSKSDHLTAISTITPSTPSILAKHKQKLETNQTTFSNAHSPPTDLLVTHGDGTVKILDYPSFDPLYTLPAHTSSCSSIAYSPTGKYLAIGGSDAMISLWDTSDWVCKRTVSNPSSGKVSGLSWSWDGRYITSASEDVGSGTAGGEGKSEGFEIYHAETGDVVATVATATSQVPAVEWHPHRYLLAYTQVEGAPGKSTLKIVGGVPGSTT